MFERSTWLFAAFGLAAALAFTLQPTLARAQSSTEASSTARSSSTFRPTSYGGGGFWFQLGYGFGSTAEQSPRGTSSDFSGYGFSYPEDWLRFGGFGQNLGFNEESNAVSTRLRFGGGGPMVGYDVRFADVLYVAADLGVGFGSVGVTRTFENADVSNIEASNLEVSSQNVRFGMAYTVAPQIGVQIGRVMRIGLRVSGTYATDYGARSMIVPSGGLNLTFGAFPE